MAEPTVVVEERVGLWDQLHQAIYWIKFLFFAAFGLGLVILLGETVRVYQTASGVHPWLGYGSLVAIGLASALIVFPIVRYLRMPHAVQPPAVPVDEKLSIAHLRREAKYLRKYLNCCSRNPEFADKTKEIADAKESLGGLESELRYAGDSKVEHYSEQITNWIDGHMPQLMADVDHKADRMIYQESLAVGMATAASPNGTLDAFVMLWRSVNLVSRLSVLYYGRPGLSGTLAVCRDVSIATAMAGYLQNVTDSLGGILTKSVGGVTGVLAGPAIEGVTNGVVLIRIGYLARERCRSFRKWDAHKRRSAILASLNATQKVAVGLATEILQKVGTSISSVAGAVAGSVSSAAGSAFNRAAELSQSITSKFRRSDETPQPNGQST